MKKSFLLLSFLSLILLSVSAQYEDVVKTRLNEVLEQRLVNVHPPKGCECNSCNFTYAKQMKIEKSRTVDGKLTVWGKAKVNYKSSFEGAGSKVVTFFAELSKDQGVVTVTKLKWQSGKCMRLTALM